jgi:type III restriction enzyme
MNNKIHEKLNLMDRSWLDVANSRFSLRIPQKEALEILAYAMEHLSKDLSLEENLAEIQKLHDRFSNFHFDFPSLCFSIATWVGKTRLMGAMIWWLYKVKKYRNFFVVAPNLTIYEKLVKDFTYWSPKYVFNGVSDFDAANPRIIDGNNYSQINTNDLVQSLQFKEFEDEVTINVFNISKFNSSKETTKIKKLSEYIGTSYFSYLQSLPDLVVLMDESHRYRAESSSQAINELKPILHTSRKRLNPRESCLRILPMNTISQMR